MTRAKAGSPERSRSSFDEPLRIRRLQRLAVVLGLSAILAAALIGWSAYNVSRRKLIEGYYSDTLRHTRLSVEYLERAPSLTLDRETLENLKRDFETRDRIWEGSYLCVMDESGKLVLNTGDTSKEGLQVGLEPFRGHLEDGRSGPANLLELLKEDGAWIGRYDSLGGRVQMAAFVYVPNFRALVAVHVPWDSVESKVNASTLPWAIGFGLIVFLAGPLTLWGLSKAYTESARAEQRAAGQVRVLREIDRAILAGGSTHEIVSAALVRVRELVSCSRMSVALFEDEHTPGRLIVVDTKADTSLGRGAVVAFDPVGMGTWERLRSGEVNAVPDLDAFQEPEMSNIMKTLRAEGIRSYVNVPLACRGTLLGTLNLGFDRVGSPTADDLDLAREVADVLALAVDQARLHEQLRQQATELERRVAERTRELSEVNAELEGYVRSVSHDLRAPLRAVRGFGNLLLEEVGGRLGATEREYLERMVSASERMDALMRDLLSYSRLTRENIGMRALDAQHVVEEAQDLLQVELDERRAVVEIAEPLLPVVGHHPSLVQAVANLLSNAAKFVREGVPPRIRIWTQPRGERVRVWVEDNGIGVATEDQERIFRVFERLNGVESYPGTGIGLAIVRRAVERMGGNVGVESHPGEGSRFWIELPGPGRDA